MMLQSVTKRTRACLGSVTSARNTIPEHPVGLCGITSVDGSVYDNWRARRCRRRGATAAAATEHLNIIGREDAGVVPARGKDAANIECPSIEPQLTRDHSRPSAPAIGNGIVDLGDSCGHRERSCSSEHVEFSIKHRATGSGYRRWDRGAGGPGVRGDIVDLQIGHFSPTVVTAGHV
jgi:hypothetical protein